MPVYRYQCACGYKHDQFLTSDKDSVLLKCAACRRGISARQVRDKTAKFASNNNVTGILRQ